LKVKSWKIGKFGFVLEVVSMVVLAGVLAFGGGVGLSVLYFGGLWLTVRRVVAGAWPKLALLGSFVVRSGLVLLGFYLVILWMGERWELLAVCLLGFIAGRTILVRRWGPRSAGASKRSIIPHS
jgi:F1F0 ATPase subunit 2